MFDDQVLETVEDYRTVGQICLNEFISKYQCSWSYSQASDTFCSDMNSKPFLEKCTYSKMQGYLVGVASNVITRWLQNLAGNDQQLDAIYSASLRLLGYGECSVTTSGLALELRKKRIFPRIFKYYINKDAEHAGKHAFNVCSDEKEEVKVVLDGYFRVPCCSYEEYLKQPVLLNWLEERGATEMKIEFVEYSLEPTALLADEKQIEQILAEFSKNEHIQKLQSVVNYAVTITKDNYQFCEAYTYARMLLKELMEGELPSILSRYNWSDDSADAANFKTQMDQRFNFMLPPLDAATSPSFWPSSRNAEEVEESEAKKLSRILGYFQNENEQNLPIVEIALRRASGGFRKVKGMEPQTDIVKYLLTQVNNIDATGAESGQTALHVAVIRKQLDIIRILLEAGARTDIRDTPKEPGTIGKTAADYASSSPDPIIASLFSVKMRPGSI